MTVHSIDRPAIDPEAKYVVFKASEFLDPSRQTEEVEPVPDAVVIRLQDIFAGPGLAAYANAVQTFIEAVTALGTDQAQTAYLDRMGALRDFFMNSAQRAFDSPVKKVPD